MLRYNLHIKDEILKLHVLLNIIQTISYSGRAGRLSILVKGRQRHTKIRNVSSFGRGLQLDRGSERHKVDKIVEEITVAYTVRNENTMGYVRYVVDDRRGSYRHRAKYRRKIKETLEIRFLGRCRQ